MFLALSHQSTSTYAQSSFSSSTWKIEVGHGCAN